MASVPPVSSISPANSCLCILPALSPLTLQLCEKETHVDFVCGELPKGLMLAHAFQVRLPGRACWSHPRSSS